VKFRETSEASDQTASHTAETFHRSLHMAQTFVDQEIPASQQAFWLIYPCHTVVCWL
jgi:hypothetical protein